MWKKLILIACIIIVVIAIFNYVKRHYGDSESSFNGENNSWLEDLKMSLS